MKMEKIICVVKTKRKTILFTYIYTYYMWVHAC